jgi:hypothetical protein
LLLFFSLGALLRHEDVCSFSAAASIRSPIHKVLLQVTTDGGDLLEEVNLIFEWRCIDTHTHIRIAQFTQFAQSGC